MRTLAEIIDKYRAELETKLGTKDFMLECVSPAAKNPYQHYITAVPFGSYVLTRVVMYGNVAFNDRVAFFQLSGMPGCCGVCVSHGASVYSQYRNKGLGTLLQLLRMDIARVNGYTVMLCTDRADNTYQNKILSKNGWPKIYDFTNKRTDNLINIHAINLAPEEKIVRPED